MKDPFDSPRIYLQIVLVMTPTQVGPAGSAPSNPREGFDLRGAVAPEYADILAPDALRFVADLHRAFEPTRQELLRRRRVRQKEISDGRLPDFLPDTKRIREAEWRVASVPRDLLDRRVEITGPVDRKMIINALNSGASVYMADFEDSN